LKSNYSFDLAKISDQNILLKWRNNRKIRQSSFKTKIVLKKEHALWFKKRLKKKNIWIFKKMNKKIGMIRLDKKNENRFELNYLIDPKYHGKNLGKKMLKTFFKKTKSKIKIKYVYAKSKNNNLTSFYTLLNSGFKIIKKNSNYHTFRFKI